MKHYREFTHGPRVYWWEWLIVKWFGKLTVTQEGDTVTCGYLFWGNLYFTRVYSASHFEDRVARILKEVYGEGIKKQFEEESILWKSFFCSEENGEKNKNIGRGYTFNIKYSSTDNEDNPA